MQTIKPCPCGETTKSLHINGQDRDKWATVSGECCNAWNVEFRNGYARIPSDESMELALRAWNESPRAEPAND